MMRNAVILFALAGCTGDLAERLDEPDVARPGNCATGTTEVTVAGRVRDFVTGQPVAGATVDVTEAWSPTRSFPQGGCALGHAVTAADGRFEIEVTGASSYPILVALVTGAGRAPTIADKTASCLFGCQQVDLEVAAPAAELAEAWRAELYAGGMEYALNRGLVAYGFHEANGAPSAGVVAAAGPDALGEDEDALDAGAQVRYLAADRATLEPPERGYTTSAGVALIGYTANSRGYYEVGGRRNTTERWYGVGVIDATGWIYVEDDTID